MKAPNKIYVEVCKDGIFAFPKPPFKESVEYIRADFVGQSLRQEQPELPDNLDEAAEKYGRENIILPDDYNDGDIDFYAEETGKVFKAGAEWMARQMKQEQPPMGYDEAYINECIAKASKTWKGVDVDKFIDEVRGRETVDLEEDVKKYFGGLWPGIETAEQCNTDMHFTPLAIMRLVNHFYELGKKEK